MFVAMVLIAMVLIPMVLVAMVLVAMVLVAMVLAAVDMRTILLMVGTEVVFLLLSLAAVVVGERES